MDAVIAKGSVVAWQYEGRAQMGFVVGATKDRTGLYVVPDSGCTARITKAVADVRLVATRDQLIDMLRAGRG